MIKYTFSGAAVDRIAVGLLFFASPAGAWERGTYALVARHADGAAERPIHLE